MSLKCIKVDTHKLIFGKLHQHSQNDGMFNYLVVQEAFKYLEKTQNLCTVIFASEIGN